MQSDISTLAFAVTNNVYIDVIDEKRHIRRKRLEVHNKATRQMVTGILRFLMGHFTDTNCNEEAEYDSAKNYIPCYISFGDGGIEIEDGVQKLQKITVDDKEITVPIFADENWTEKVSYNSTSLVREFFSNQENKPVRQKIRDKTNTLQNLPTVDMDSIFYYCKIPPNALNTAYGHSVDIAISEVGLFAGEQIGENDLLAYIKLGDMYDDSDPTQITGTNTLYVRPQDTIEVRWIITIAAVGKDSRLFAYAKDEQGNIIVDNTGLPDAANIKEVEVTDTIGQINVSTQD